MTQAPPGSPATAPATRSRSAALPVGRRGDRRDRRVPHWASTMSIVRRRSARPSSRSAIPPPQNVTFDFDVTVGPATISPNGKTDRVLGARARRPHSVVGAAARCDRRASDRRHRRRVVSVLVARQSVARFLQRRARAARTRRSRRRRAAVDRARGFRARRELGAGRHGPVRHERWRRPDHGSRDRRRHAEVRRPRQRRPRGRRGSCPTAGISCIRGAATGRSTSHRATARPTTSSPTRRRTPSTPTGHLLFMRENTLLAQPFDPVDARLPDRRSRDRARVQMLLGDPRGVFSASETGTLLYLDGAGTSSMTLAWFDGEGTRAGMVGEVGSARGVRLSPDGRPASDRVDRRRGTSQPLDARPGHAARASQLTFAQDPELSELVRRLVARRTVTGRIRVKRDNGYAIARRPSTGGAEEILFTLAAGSVPTLPLPRVTAWTNDGVDDLLFRMRSSAASGPCRSRPPRRAARAAQCGEGSETAQNVRLWPERAMVLVSGGARRQRRSQGSSSRRIPAAAAVSRWPRAVRCPLWSADGRSLYYADDNMLTVVSVTEADGALRFGPPARRHADHRRARLFVRRRERRPHPRARLRPRRARRGR